MLLLTKHGSQCGLLNLPGMSIWVFVHGSRVYRQLSFSEPRDIRDEWTYVVQSVLIITLSRYIPRYIGTYILCYDLLKISSQDAQSITDSCHATKVLSAYFILATCILAANMISLIPLACTGPL